LDSEVPTTVPAGAAGFEVLVSDIVANPPTDFLARATPATKGKPNRKESGAQQSLENVKAKHHRASRLLGSPKYVVMVTQKQQESCTDCEMIAF